MYYMFAYDYYFDQVTDGREGTRDNEPSHLALSMLLHTYRPALPRLPPPPRLASPRFAFIVVGAYLL